MRDYWQKQTPDKPLFPGLLWSRPESKASAGKLLIIGGSAHGFATPAETFVESQRAGVGSVRVLLPDALQKIVGTHLETAEFALSTPSGSFSQSALAQWLDLSAWANGVLVAGDLGHNSETAILLEKFLAEYSGQVTLTKDAADYAVSIPESVLGRPNILLVITTAELQKLFVESKQSKAISFSMDLLNLVEALHEFTGQSELSIIVKHLDQLIVAVKGRVSTTPAGQTKDDFWRVKTAAYASVWLAQQPVSKFKALTSSIYEIINHSKPN